MLAFVAVAAVLLLTGCRSATPFGPTTELLLAVLVAVKNAKSLVFSRDEERPDEVDPITDDDIVENGHKAWFIFRRAQIMIARHPAFTEAQLTAAISAQFDQIALYLQSKLGPGHALAGLAEVPGGTSSATADEAFTYSPAHHFDLGNMAILKKGGVAGARGAVYRQLRHRSVRSVAWHAAGLHDELWSDGGDGATLNELALNELVDRRVRACERMLLQINARPFALHSDGFRGPWTDGSRVRVFEYPYFAKALVDPSEIGHIYSDFDATTVQYEWLDNGRLWTRFNDEPGPPGEDPEPSADWLPAGTYQRVPSTLSIAASLDELLQSRLDMWERAWLFCDHSIAATQLEALKFALLRRPPVEDFDDLVRPKAPVVGAIMPSVLDNPMTGTPFVPDSNRLFSDGVQTTDPEDTGVFDSLVVPYRDLQVGDHCILWNHHLYVSVTRGPWRLENAFITQTNVVTDDWDDVDEIKPGTFMSPSPDKMVLSGFGETHNYPTFLRKLLEQIEAPFNAIFALIPVIGSATFFVVPESAQRAVVIRWTPYATGIDGTPWFLFLPRISFADDGTNWPDKFRMHQAIKHSVIEGTGRGTGYQPIPLTEVLVPGEVVPRQLTDGVFFPMHLPVVDGSEMDWDEYFTLRAGSSSVPETTLSEMILAPEMIPGFFVRGEGQPIQVIRPRVRP
jgi:hypothetical protein